MFLNRSDLETHSQVIPSQPTAKNELKTKRKAAATIPAAVLRSSALLPSFIEFAIARTTMDNDMPTAPKSMSERRPNFSIMKTGIQETKKYSVPLHAARIREMKGLRPT